MKGIVLERLRDEHMGDRLFVYESLLYNTSIGTFLKEIRKPEYWPGIAPGDFSPIPENVEAFARQFEGDIDTTLLAIENEIKKMHTFAQNFTQDKMHPLFDVQSIALSTLGNVIMLLEQFESFSLKNFEYYWKRMKKDSFIHGIGRISGLEAMKYLKIPQTNLDGLEEAMKQYKNVISRVLNRLNDEFVGNCRIGFRRDIQKDGRAREFSSSDITRKKIHEKILKKAMAVHTKDERDQLRQTMQFLFPKVRPPGPLPVE